MGEGNPLSVDLWAEVEGKFRVNCNRNKAEQAKQRVAARLQREAHGTIFARAAADVDEMEDLRAERRLLKENEKQLKAMRDVEKGNARSAKVLQQRKDQEVQKQQHQLIRAMSSTGI